jgi:hypothetical protein
MSLLLKISRTVGEGFDRIPGQYDPGTQVWSPDIRNGLTTLTGTSTYPTMSGTTGYGGTDEDQDDQGPDPDE